MIQYGQKFTLEGPDGTKAVFNDSADGNYVGILAAAECSGLDSADVRDNGQERTEEHGGVHGNFYYGRRPIILAGTIIASSATQRNERAERLQRASNALTGDAKLSWTPTGGAARYAMVRRQQPLRVVGGWVKSFQLALVSADAYLQSDTLHELTANVESTGFKSPGTMESIEPEESPREPWGTVDNAKVSDNAWAVAWTNDKDQNTDWLRGTNFGFSVPSNSVINRFRAKLERKSAEGTAFIDGERNGTVVLLNNPIATMYTSESQSWGAEAICEYGNKANENGSYIGAWSTWYTPASTNHSSFGWDVQARSTKAGTAAVDHMQMAVEYVKALEATNAGSVLCHPTIRIYGEVYGVMAVENLTTGEHLTVNFELDHLLADTEWFDIDFKNRTVVDQDGVNKYSTIEYQYTDWWALAPGANLVVVRPALETEGGTMEIAVPPRKVKITYRDAWL